MMAGGAKNVWLRVFILSGALVRIGSAADTCQWETQVGDHVYSFNLAATVDAYPHGVTSEDGHYQIAQPSRDNSSDYFTFYFQLCQRMKFLTSPPTCQQCPQSCGGRQHCGEGCLALREEFDHGYSRCTSLENGEGWAYSLIDSENPTKGLTLSMSGGDSLGCPDGLQSSLTVEIGCVTGAIGEVTYMTHPAGCPVATAVGNGGNSWLTIVPLVLLAAAAVYVVGGVGFKMYAEGARGAQAIPHLEFWQGLPYHVQNVYHIVVDFVREVYGTFTRSTYTRVV